MKTNKSLFLKVFRYILGVVPIGMLAKSIVGLTSLNIYNSEPDVMKNPTRDMSENGGQ
jgi:hypothetical protein